MKQEKESNYVELESWIWESLLNYMGSAKEVTLLDTTGVKVQAEVNMMALASRSEGIMQKSGTISSLAGEQSDNVFCSLISNQNQNETATFSNWRIPGQTS